MKKNGRHRNNNNGQAIKPVRLEFTHPTAAEVAIAGSFNNWRPKTTQMVSLGKGRWRKELALPPGTYEYLVVADGKWQPDPLARDTTPNPFGGVNSVIYVPESESRPTSQSAGN